MKWKYNEMKGQVISLTSRRRTYRFKCTDVLRLNEYNLKLFGYGPEPDPIFTMHSTINLAGEEHGTSVKATKRDGTDRYDIETETILTDPTFWGDTR